MTRAGGIVIGLLMVVTSGCGSNGSNGSNGANRDASGRAQLPNIGAGGAVMMQTATFNFVSADDQGTPLVRGQFTLPWPIAEGQVVRGSWESRYVGPPSTTRPGEELNAVGPQVGRGQLTAEREGGEVRINLNPNMNDNNVTLVAEVQGDALLGRWDFATFAGSAAGGAFEAQQQRRDGK